jgi:hypothetical protein
MQCYKNLSYLLNNYVLMYILYLYLYITVGIIYYRYFRCFNQNIKPNHLFYIALWSQYNERLLYIEYTDQLISPDIS